MPFIRLDLLLNSELWYELIIFTNKIMDLHFLFLGSKLDTTPLGRSSVANIISSSTQMSGNITMQKPAQITLATSVPAAQTVPSGTTFHVPRGPAAVANLAAPRSNVVPAIRASMVVTAQTGQVCVNITIKSYQIQVLCNLSVWKTIKLLIFVLSDNKTNITVVALYNKNDWYLISTFFFYVDYFCLIGAWFREATENTESGSRDGMANDELFEWLPDKGSTHCSQFARARCHCYQPRCYW